MPCRKVGSAVVITAQRFNPSVVSQLWLVNKGLLVEEDFLPQCMFSDMLVQVLSRPFNLLALPNQLQFAPNVPPEEEQALIVAKLGTIVQKLPETPYQAIGLNLCWHLSADEGGISCLTRQLFFRSDKMLYRLFDVPDARFGVYLSKDVPGFRMKLDIKPLRLPSESGAVVEIVQFAFNFHADLGVNAAERIVELLHHWNVVRKEAQTVIDSIENRG